MKNIVADINTQNNTNDLLVRCPVCMNNLAISNFIVTYWSNFCNIEYKLYHCAKCHVEFWSPLEIIPEFYENETIDIYSQMHAGLNALPRHCLQFFKLARARHGRLLDVGCGDGIFLHNVEKDSRFRFDLYGLDLDKESVAKIRSRYGIDKVFCCKLDEFNSHTSDPTIGFDIVTFFDVLEHQDKPMEFMNNIKSLLLPGGYISGSVPNAKRYFAKYERKISSIDLPPHHFIYFTDDCLRKFLQSMGFENIEIYPVKLDFLSMIVLVEKLLLGRLSYSIRNNISKKELQREMMQNSDKFINIRTGLAKKILRVLRNLLFAPIALCLFSIYNKRGPQLYFQASIK